MLKTLLFGSTNPHKLEEVRNMVPHGYTVNSLTDIGWTTDIEEPFETFEENAAQKTKVIFEETGLPCFAEDSGLVVDALDGNPGVYSARYAGVHRDMEANIQKVLSEMNDVINRKAYFISVIAYKPNETSLFLFTGKVFGTIASQKEGEGGFGYDPVFIPSGFHQTFGVLDPTIKHKISHRSKSFALFIEFLQQH